MHYVQELGLGHSGICVGRGEGVWKSPKLFYVIYEQPLIQNKTG